MGFADRDYNRGPGGPAGAGPVAQFFAEAPVTTWLIGINVGVFLVELLLGIPFTPWGYFSAARALGEWEVWRFLSFQFLHANLTHLFFNMFSLYFFGALVERYLGSRRYLAFYLLCGVAGAVMYLGLWMVGLLDQGPRTRLVGASAGIFGVLIAAARVAPDARVMLLFPPIPMRLRTFAWVLIGVAVVTILYAHVREARYTNAGGEAAHLGGAALGALLIRRPRLLDFADRVGGGGRRR